LNNILVCADIHCRNKPEGMLFLYRRLMRTVTKTAINEGCRFVFHVGDLLHEKHCTLVELLIMLYGEFEYARSQGVTWVLIPGNHDMPQKDKPMLTILHMFRRVAMVYLKPRVLKAKGWSIYLQPWRLADEFKRNCTEMAKAAKLDENPFRLQLAHIGLAEGVMSDSNSYRVPSPVRVSDLYPNLYTLTLCGDYHSTQQLHDRLWYMGAPIAHMFGDNPSQGVWIVNMDTGHARQEELPGEWPHFITRTLITKEDLDLNPSWQYKLRVSPEMKAYYSLHYGDVANVKIESIAGAAERVPGSRRLEGVSEGDTRKVLQIWLQKKGYLEDEYFRWGDEYLSRAERVLFESRA